MSWLHGVGHGRDLTREDQEESTEGGTPLVTAVTRQCLTCFPPVTAVTMHQGISPPARHGRDELPGFKPTLAFLELVILNFGTCFLSLFSFL